MKKIVVSPQIVIYQNAIESSNEIINYLEGNPRGIFNPWQDWYSQGYRTNLFIDKNNLYKHEDKELNRQNYIILNLINSFEKIVSDYFNDFGQSKGMWPSFIKNWNKIKYRHDIYNIDFFKYEYDKVKKNYKYENNNLLLEYHVDEFINLNKKEKHVVTVNFYLNDDYEGGEICMYDSISKKVYRYKPKAGDVVIMPSTSPFYHAVKYFHNKDRYFCRIFVDYNDDSIINDSDNIILEDQYVKDHLQTIKIFENEIVIGENI